MFFRQRSTYEKRFLQFDKNKKGNSKFEYIRNIQLCPLKNHSEKKVYYDKELDMHFESSQSFKGYEIEVKDVYTDFDREIRKTP